MRLFGRGTVGGRGLVETCWWSLTVTVTATVAVSWRPPAGGRQQRQLAIGVLVVAVRIRRASKPGRVPPGFIVG